MNLGWVFGIAGIFLALAVMVPGLLLALTLLLPGAVARARSRITAMPWRCGFIGLATLLPLGLLLIIIFNLPGGFGQLVGWIGVSVSLAAMSLGGAALATLMCERMYPLQQPTPGGLVRAAIALELALIVPLLGWFVLLPIVALVSLGAAMLALLRPALPQAVAAIAEDAHAYEPA